MDGSGAASAFDEEPGTGTGYIDFESMQQPLTARVRNGRLVLDEPTDLPEGEEVELVPVGDDLDIDDRAGLHESIAESIEQMERGELIDGEEALAQLRAHR